MSSGVRWNETYTDPKSDRRDCSTFRSLSSRGAALDLMARLPRAAPVRDRDNYNTGVDSGRGRGAAQATKADAIGIFERANLEAGRMGRMRPGAASPDGMRSRAADISATLRDYAPLSDSSCWAVDGSTSGSPAARMVQEPGLRSASRAASARL